MEDLEPGRPSHENFRHHIAGLIARSGKTRKEIARGLGYTNSNMITLFKNGDTRVPHDKVVALARQLSHPPGALLEEWMLAYMPTLLEDVRTHLGAI